MVKFCPFKHAAWIACHTPNIRELRNCDMADCEMWDKQRQMCGLKAA
jgi:hypothetical protein